MPPHCDSLDGPVVVAARRALVEHDVDLVLPYVSVDSEDEVREAFDLTMKARVLGDDAQQVADRWFFECVVRLHRAGEGAPFTGLKPAGLEVGEVIPAAEGALASGSGDELSEILSDAVRSEVEHRLAHAMELQPPPGASVAEVRRYVDAMLGLQVWAHAVHRQVQTDPHQHLGAHEHG
jgi:hypothetical protein